MYRTDSGTIPSHDIGVMTRADEHYDRARECLRRTETASNEERRKDFVRLAVRWTQVAFASEDEEPERQAGQPEQQRVAV